MTDSVIMQLQQYISEKTGAASARAASTAIHVDRVRIHFIAAKREDTQNAPFNTDAPFLIYDISTTFTAAAILRLVSSGRLELDSPLSRRLPDMPNTERLTVRQCLQHTGGLPDYSSLAAYQTAVRSGTPPWSDKEFLERTHAHKLLFEPGSRWQYSNIGYLYLRRLLEIVCGSDYGDVLKEEIFTPLDLSRTFVPTRRSEVQDLIFGPGAYPTDEEHRDTTHTPFDPGWIPEGVVASTAKEIATFIQALFNNTLLPSSIADEMCNGMLTGSASLPMFSQMSYGLGVVSLETPLGGIYGHTGSGPGVAAAAYHLKRPGCPITAVILADGGEAREVEHMIYLVFKRLAGS